MNISKKHIEEVKQKLNLVYKQDQLKSLLKGINITIIVVFAINLIVSLAVMSGANSVKLRTVLFYMGLGVVLINVIVFIILPLIKYFQIAANYRYLELAKRTGERYPQIKDKLINALQIIEDNNSYGYSVGLVNAAFETVSEKIKPLDFKKVVSFDSLKNYFKLTSVVIILSAILFTIFPTLREASFQAINYNLEFINPAKFSIQVLPGNSKVSKGENFDITVNTIGESPENMTLAVKSIEQTEYENHELKKDSLGNFTFRVNAVKSTFEYYAFSEGIFSEVYETEVINQPIISSLEAIIIPPKYSGIPTTVQKDNGNLYVLPGTRIELNIKTNKELAAAIVLFDDSTKSVFNTDKKEGQTNFTVFKNNKYVIRITDSEGYDNSAPIKYNISILVDEHPSINIISPGEDVTINNSNQLPITAEIADDFGFSKLFLNYKITSSLFEEAWTEFRKVEISISKEIEQQVYYVWDLNNVMLAVEDVLSYFLEVFDNDNINGPKSAKSPLFNVRVPSLDELFANAEEKQNEAEQDLTKLLEETKELTEEMQRISNEIKQDERELTWEEKEKIEQAMKNFEELSDKAEDVQKKINDMQKDLQENNLLSEETLQKYMELQDLMDELSSDEFKETLQRMQEMLQQMNRDQAQMSFEEMQFNEEMFQKSLERTLNLLKRIQIEQKIDELVKRTEDIVNQLENLQEEAQKTQSKPESEQLAEKQDQVSEKLENLKNEMEKLNQKMEEFDDLPTQDLEKMRNEMDKQQNQELSEQIKQQLQQMMMQQAKQNQQQLSQNMQNIQQQMMQMQQNMQMQTQMQALYEMMKSTNDLLTLSKDQEKLKDQTSRTPPTTEEFKERAKEQSNINRNLDRVLDELAKLSQKSFAITPEIGQALGKARSEMNNAIGSMNERIAGSSVQQQGAAMKHLNEAASLMKGSMEQMMQGGQGGGMMSLMQQMQQMAQKQMQLNQMTQQLNQQGQMSPQQQSQLQRLAQEQEAIRKSLEQLNKEAKESGQTKKLSTNIEKILQEMQEVVSGMQTEKLNDNLVQSQERILSKLLEAQRSINERDFEKERESQVGKTFNRESPPEIIFGTKEGRDQLRDELLNAVKEGYNKDYEELIRKYFEALQKK